MGNYEQLKQSVSDVIKTNGNQEITGSILQNVLLTIISSVGANATFAGIATPATNPGTPDGLVFYLASESGTYTNFGGAELQDGLSLLTWNGSWSSQQIFGVDDEPTAGSDNLVKSGGVAEELALGAVYDVSAKNPTGGSNNDGKWESLSALLSDVNINTLIPTPVRKGGMSIKFVQSSDNKYVQYMCKSSTFSTTPTDWEKVNNVKVSQNTSTGHTDIIVGDVTFPAASGKQIEAFAPIITKKGLNTFFAKYNTSGNSIVETEPNQSVYQSDFGVEEGQKILVYGYGGETYRLWAFVNSNGDIIEKSDGSLDKTQDGILLTVPENATRLIISCYKTHSDSFYVFGGGGFANFANKVFQQGTEIETIKQDVDIVTGYNKTYNKNDTFTSKWNTKGDAVVETAENPAVKQLIINLDSYKETITVKGSGADIYRLWAFVDADGIIVSKSASMENTISNPVTLDVPDGATKLYLSCYAHVIDDFEAVVSKKALQSQINTLVQQTNSNTDNIATLQPDVQTLKDTINGHSDSYDKTNATQGIYATNGTVVESTSPSDAVRQLKLDVQAGQKVTVYGYGANTYRLWAFADASNNILAKSADGRDARITPDIVEVPENAIYLYVSCYTNHQDTLLVTIQTIGQEQRISSLEEIAGNITLQGKKAYFIGDSIMIGQPNVDAVRNITYFLNQKYGLDCHNNAAGGSVFLYPWYIGNAYSIYYQLTQVPQDTEFIIIQGGVNGVNMDDPSNPNYAPMGEISATFDDNFDKTTQIGCLEAICQYLYNNFAGKKYGFIMTYEIGSYAYWKNKAAQFMQVLKKWSIPVLDWRESGISLASLLQQTQYGIDSYALYPQYDEDEGYSVDDKVIYNNSTYKANEAIAAPAGSFDSSKWTLISTSRYDTWHCNRLAYERLAHITGEWIKKI